jgi:Lectin C-type domain
MWAHSHEFLTESFWGDNRPNKRAGNSDDCVVVSLRDSVQWWEDRSCLIDDTTQDAIGLICQHDSIEAAPKSNTTTFQCPSGWLEFEGHCYLLKSDIEMWWTAEENCLEYGAHLASIHSEAEDEFITAQTNSTFWMGAYFQNDFWTWSDGSDWNFSNWHYVVHPSTYPCAFNYPSLGWINQPCGIGRNYICKF